MQKIIFCSQFEKKAVYAITFYLQFSCVARYLKRSNDTLELNIHKYTNYNIIEVYINRLSTTTQIFIAMDYLILMSEKYHHFRKSQKHVLQKYLSNTCTHKTLYIQDLEKNNSGCIKVNNFRKSVNSKPHRSLH